MTIQTQSGAFLLDPTSMVRHDRGGGASTTPLVSPAIGSSSFITGYTTFAPGVEIPFHHHNCQESVVLMEGEALLDIDGQEFPVEPHQVTFIPANVDHRFRNRSTTKPMKILWIYASADATRTLTATGQTHFVSAEHNKPIPAKP